MLLIVDVPGKKNRKRDNGSFFLVCNESRSQDGGCVRSCC